MGRGLGLWLHFGVILGDFFGDSKKAVRMELAKGGGHAIRPHRRMFREGRPLSLWLHFGVILGAKFATILLFGRPGGQNRLTKERLNKS